MFYLMEQPCLVQMAAHPTRYRHMITKATIHVCILAAGMRLD